MVLLMSLVLARKQAQEETDEAMLVPFAVQRVVLLA